MFKFTEKKLKGGNSIIISGDFNIIPEEIDAHAPEEVGMNFEEAASLASDIGFTHTVRFEKRARTEMPFSI